MILMGVAEMVRWMYSVMRPNSSGKIDLLNNCNADVIIMSWAWQMRISALHIPAFNMIYYGCLYLLYPLNFEPHLVFLLSIAINKRRLGNFNSAWLTDCLGLGRTAGFAQGRWHWLLIWHTRGWQGYMRCRQPLRYLIMVDMWAWCSHSGTVFSQRRCATCRELQRDTQAVSGHISGHRNCLQ